MKILFLTHYFPPEVNAPASRTFEHAKRWAKEGHQVTVLTSAPNHPTGKIYSGYKNKLLHKEIIDGIKVVRVWTYLAPNKGFLRRTINYVSFGIMSILMSPATESTDIVVSTSPQFFCGLAGYFVGKIKKVPWVLEIRDLWPESIVAVGAIKNRAIISFLELLERFAYEKADRIVSVTDSFKKYIAKKGIPSSKIEIIKNGADLSLFVPLPRQNTLSEKLGLNNKFVVSYFGTHGMAHGLEIVLEAAKKLLNKKDIVFLMVGDGADRENLLAVREKHDLDNVIMIRQVPKKEMPYYWATSDACMVLLRKNDLFKTVIPSKIFEAMAMERPIILGVNGESRTIVEANAAGICIEPGNADQLASAVLDLYNDRSLVCKLGENGRKCVEKEFNRDVSAQRYLSVMVDVIKRR